MAPGFTNPDVATEYRVQIEAETGPDGALESTAASFVPSEWYGFDVTAAFAGPGDGAAHANPIYQQTRIGEAAEWPFDFLMWDSPPSGWFGDITLQPLRENTGNVVPEGPTILETGAFTSELYELGGWWVEGPEGATGVTVTAEPVDDVELPITGETIPRLRVQFRAGDLPGRYIFHWGYSEGQRMYVDVVE